MSAAFETIRIPKQLYVRLRRLADNEKVEPVNLIERLLTQALLQEQLDAAVQTESVAPIYRLHEYAEDLGVTDLAENIDHYLYGHDKAEDKLTATSLSFQKDTFTLYGSNGEQYVFPYSVSPRLLLASQHEREAGELMPGGYGIEWEAINEHLSVDGLIHGKVSTETWRSVYEWYEMRRDEQMDVETLLEPILIFA